MGYVWTHLDIIKDVLGCLGRDTESPTIPRYSVMRVFGVDIGSITGAMLFWFIGAGVFLIVFSSIKMGSFQTILQINDASTMGGNFTPVKEHQTYSNKTVEAIMSVYWSTVTCIYLIWSFVTFDWYITWIVWPIAAIVQMVVNNIFGED